MTNEEIKNYDDVNANPYVNKVIKSNGDVIIDLTGDDITAADVLSGKKAHLPSGEAITGTCNYDAKTTDATATAAQILEDKTAYVNKAKVTGTMTNRGAIAETIDTVDESVVIAAGYHDGSGTVAINATEQGKLIAGNIKQGVKILGVTGTHSGTEDVKATILEATPSWTAQDILPSSKGDYNYFSECKIAAITYTETDNPQGGKTVTIG